MAFTYALNNNGVAERLGRRKLVTGTFANSGGDTGGDIVTGLRRVLSFKVHVSNNGLGSTTLQKATANYDAYTSVLVENSAFPLETGTVTIYTSANADGYWEALGE